MAQKNRNYNIRTIAVAAAIGLGALNTDAQQRSIHQTAGGGAGFGTPNTTQIHNTAGGSVTLGAPARSVHPVVNQQVTIGQPPRSYNNYRRHDDDDRFAVGIGFGGGYGNLSLGYAGRNWAIGASLPIGVAPIDTGYSYPIGGGCSPYTGGYVAMAYNVTPFNFRPEYVYWPAYRAGPYRCDSYQEFAYYDARITGRGVAYIPQPTVVVAPAPAYVQQSAPAVQQQSASGIDKNAVQAWTVNAESFRPEYIYWPAYHQTAADARYFSTYREFKAMDDEITGKSAVGSASGTNVKEEARAVEIQIAKDVWQNVWKLALAAGALTAAFFGYRNHQANKAMRAQLNAMLRTQPAQTAPAATPAQATAAIPPAATAASP